MNNFMVYLLLLIMHVNVINKIIKKLAQLIELNAVCLTLNRPIICYLNALWRALCGTT